MLDELGGTACWLDGAVRVRLESRRISDPHPWLDALARPNRPPLVEALAVYFDPDTSPEEVDGVPGDGRRADPREMPVRAVSADQASKPAGWPA